MLEDVPGIYGGEPHWRGVRVLFQHDSKGWQAFQSGCPDQDCLRTAASTYPAEQNWFVGFNGRNLSEVEGKTLTEFRYYSQVGLQRVSGMTPALTVGKRTREFSGFLDEPVYRPLVTLSVPLFSDPEAWKPAKTSAESVALVIAELHKLYPTVSRCMEEDEPVQNPFPDKIVKVGKSYKSKYGSSLVTVDLSACVPDDELGDPLTNQWFFIGPNRKVSYVGRGLRLVDTGDYDKDGKSEVVFLIDSYNRGGYELFYDNFKKHVTFEFNYH